MAPPAVTVESDDEDESSSKAQTESSSKSARSSSINHGDGYFPDREGGRNCGPYTSQTDIKTPLTPSRAPSTRSHRRGPSQDHESYEAQRHERTPSRGSSGFMPVQPAYPSPAPSRASRTPSTGSREMPPPPLLHRTNSRGHSAQPSRRPGSYHEAMGSFDPRYPVQVPPPYRDRGPPPSRSAYTRPGPSVVPIPPPLIIPPPTVPPDFHGGQGGFMPPPRARSDNIPTSTPWDVSARRPKNLMRYGTSPHLTSPMTQYPLHPSDMGHDVQPLSARTPKRPINHVAVGSEYAYYSQSDSGSGYDDDESPRGFMHPIERIHRDSASISDRTISPRGNLGYSQSAANATYESGLLLSGNYNDDRSDYLSSSKYTSSSGSSRPRRPSISSGTRGTSYSASSGSARRHSTLIDPNDQIASAKRYMEQTDHEALHTRVQQPELTQEMLRTQAKQIQGRMASRSGASASSRRRDTSFDMDGDQKMKILVNATAGLNMRFEGAQNIAISREPGGEDIIIESAPKRSARTVYDHESVSATSRSRMGGSKDASRTARDSELGASRVSRAAVSNKRDR